MVRKLEPLIGEWYRDHGEQRLFEIVAMDDDEGRIDIQYADGEVFAINRDNWRNLMLSVAPPPDEQLNGQAADRDPDTETGELPAADWHDSHLEFGTDEDY